MTRIGNYDGLKVGGVTAMPLLVSTRTLTDAEIKHLPTLGLECVAAPGSGLASFPLYAMVFAKTTAGAYTNINAAGFLLLSATAGCTLQIVANDGAITNGSTTNLTDLLGTANNRCVPAMFAYRTEDVDEWGPIALVESASSWTNKAMTLSLNNGGSSDLTGGNAANTLTVMVFYVVVTVP